MLEPQSVPLGPLLVPLPLLVALVLLWAGGRFAIRFVDNGSQEKGKITDHLLEAAMIYLLFWKWSSLLLNPAELLHNPQALLYASGSEGEMWLAAAAAGGFLLWSARRNGVRMSHILDQAAVAALVAGIGYSLLFLRWGELTGLPWGITPEGGTQLYHPVHIYRALFLSIILALWWWRRNRLGSGESFAWIALGSGVGLLLVSYWDYYPLRGTLGLAGSQWLFVLLAVSGWLRLVKEKR